MRHLVSIKTIDMLSPIEGADRIEKPLLAVGTLSYPRGFTPRETRLST